MRDESVRLSSGRSFRTWILVVACVRRIDIHSNTRHLCRSKEHETSFFFRGAARLKCPRFPGYARDLSVRDARYKFKKKKTNVLCFALRPLDEAKEFNSQNPNSSTSVYRNIFFLAFFFFGFLASRIHLLGRGDEKKTKQREKKTNMSFYIRP